MKRILIAGGVFAIAVIGVGEWRQPEVGAQQSPPQPAATVVTAPALPWDSNTEFLKYSPDMNLGEVLGVAVNSKGRIAVLNHPGSPTSGPVYGNASTQLLEFDANGKFVREVGKGVYGLAYGHGIRYDRFDNLWVVDKGTHAAVALQPGGLRDAESRPPAGGPRRARLLRPRSRRPGPGARRRLFRRARPTSPSTPTTTSTSATATATRASPSSTRTATG